MSQSPLTVVIAGSTQHTQMCAEALLEDSRFLITGMLTPAPKPSGRKKEVQPNSLHQFALDKKIPFVLIETKINEDIDQKLRSLGEPPALLLVVDFGYIVPTWLLDWPTIGPVNIHPSDLPMYRGSSPGQFALLFNEQESAISIIKMDAQLDHGPIITKILFSLLPTWTAQEYYQHAFSLVTKQLPQILLEFNGQGSEQVDVSPTPTARMLRREDGFIPLLTLKDILSKGLSAQEIPLLSAYGLSSDATTLFNMWRGLTPWPGLWTTVVKKGVESRLKILKLTKENTNLKIDSVQFEGKNPAHYTPELLEEN